MVGLFALVVPPILALVPVVIATLSIFGLGAVVLAAWRTLCGGGAVQPVLQHALVPA